MYVRQCSINDKQRDHLAALLIMVSGLFQTKGRVVMQIEDHSFGNNQLINDTSPGDQNRLSSSRCTGLPFPFCLHHHYLVIFSMNLKQYLRQLCSYLTHQSHKWHNSGEFRVLVCAPCLALLFRWEVRRLQICNSGICICHICIAVQCFWLPVLVQIHPLCALLSSLSSCPTGTPSCP